MSPRASCSPRYRRAERGRRPRVTRQIVCRVCSMTRGPRRDRRSYHREHHHPQPVPGWLSAARRRCRCRRTPPPSPPKRKPARGSAGTEFDDARVMMLTPVDIVSLRRKPPPDPDQSAEAGAGAGEPSRATAYPNVACAATILVGRTDLPVRPVPATAVAASLAAMSAVDLAVAAARRPRRPMMTGVRPRAATAAVRCPLYRPSRPRSKPPGILLVADMRRGRMNGWAHQAAAPATAPRS